MPARSPDDEKVDDTKACFKLMLSLSGSMPKGEAPTSLKPFKALPNEWSCRLEVIRRLPTEKQSDAMYVLLMRKKNSKVLCQVGAAAKEMKEVPAPARHGRGAELYPRR